MEIIGFQANEIRLSQITFVQIKSHGYGYWLMAMYSLVAIFNGPGL